MKSSWLKLCTRLFSVLVIGGILLAPSTSALANVRVEGGNVPFYARIDNTDFYNDAGLVAIVFYRLPTCIPAGFNLLDFFDIPGAFACDKTTQGFEIWKNGPGLESAPILSELKGLGTVPVWFVSVDAVRAAMADGNLTIGELSSLNPLIGFASFFHETLRLTSMTDAAVLEINASGNLSDGRSFNLHIVHATYPKTKIDIK